MKVCRFVFLQSCATSKSSGYTPEAKDVFQAIEVGQQTGLDVQVYLVDPTYVQYLRKHRTKSDVVANQEELDRLSELIAAGATVGPSPSYLKEVTIATDILPRFKQIHIIPDRYENWGEATGHQIPAIKDFRFPDTDWVVYISYFHEFDAYETMGYLNDSRIQNRLFLSPKTRINLTQLVIDTPTLIATPVYSFYRGEEIKGDFYQLSAAKKHISLGIMMLELFLNAEFDRDEFRVRQYHIPSWTLNWHTPVTRLLIDHYEMYSDIPDQRPDILLVESGQYRRELTHLLIKVFSNFVINNRLLDLNQVKELGGWYQPETWRRALELIDAWQIPAVDRGDVPVIDSTQPAALPAAKPVVKPPSRRRRGLPRRPV